MSLIYKMKKKVKKQVIKGVPQALRKIVSKAVGDYRWELGMQIWKVDISYVHEDKQVAEGDDVAASIWVNRRYLEATISIYPNTIKRFTSKIWEEKDVREVIAHEISHIATQHFFDVATARYCDDGEMKDAWETCTSVIGKLVYQLDRERSKKS